MSSGVMIDVSSSANIGIGSDRSESGAHGSFSRRTGAAYGEASGSLPLMLALSALSARAGVFAAAILAHLGGGPSDLPAAPKAPQCVC